LVRLVRVGRPAWPGLAGSVATGFGAAVSGIGLTFAASWLIVRASQHPPVLYLTVAIVCVRAFGIGRGVLRYTERLMGHRAAFDVLQTLRLRVYDGLTRSVPSGGRDLRSGDVVANLVSDVDTSATALVRVVQPVTVAIVTGIAAAIVLGAILPTAGLALAAALLAAYAAVPALHTVLARRAEARTAPLQGELAAQIVELVHGAPDLVAYDAAASRLAALGDTDDRLRRAAARSSTALGLGSGLIMFAGGAASWAALVLGIAATRHSTVDPVWLGVIALTPLAVFDALSFLPSATAEAGRARGALRRVFALVDAPAAAPDPEAPAPTPAPPYRLTLESVTAGWDGPDVVRGLDLTLEPGQRVALVGPSGAGKSTVAALCARLLDPRTGTVRLNATDLRELTGDQVRSVIAYVAADAHVFDSTIGDNLRIGRPTADESSLWQALAAVRLDDWVRSLPDGLDTPVGERGERLSGGQRRRLVLARALVADRPILVIDEPTEHLDPPTAQAMVDDILDLPGDRSVLLITHQPYGLDRMDAIVRL
jgi:thiol reductant ABC exporter CydC subunit